MAQHDMQCIISGFSLTMHLFKLFSNNDRRNLLLMHQNNKQVIQKH